MIANQALECFSVLRVEARNLRAVLGYDGVEQLRGQRGEINER